MAQFEFITTDHVAPEDIAKEVKRVLDVFYQEVPGANILDWTHQTTAFGPGIVLTFIVKYEVIATSQS